MNTPHTDDTKKTSYVSRLVPAFVSGALPKSKGQFAYEAALAVVRSLPSPPTGSKPSPRITFEVKTARGLVGRVKLVARALVEDAVHHRYATRRQRASVRQGQDPLQVPFVRRIPHLIAERRRREEERDYACARALFDLSMSDEWNASVGANRVDP